MRRRQDRLIGPVVAIAVLGLMGTIGGTAAAGPVDRPGGDPPRCKLDNGIQHVISIQFDNVHLTRDNPNVPSDLEQMPNLLGFLRENGTVLTKDHDVLLHTASNFTSNQTGLYPDRTDVTQSNSFKYFDANGQPHSGVSFAYWTDPLYDPSGAPADTTYNMDYSANRAANPVTTNVDAPAPWVPYTRGGCDVGEVGMANTVLENVATDIPTVFGANSPQQAEATANATKATADYVGLAVHCAATSSTCAAGQTDALPDEPGGYSGYRALFGNAEVAPAISPAGPVTNLDGAVIADAHGNNGFPGFDALTPTNSLAYAADMEEHGIPVVNVYVSDVHGDHSAANTGDLGPASATYEAQLHAYDTAFGQFLARLRTDGITPANTLFAVTTDEGDHFSGSAATPTGCTGAANNLCSYTTRSEVNVNLAGLLATKTGNTTPFTMHTDPAPAIYVTGNPAPGSATVRSLEHDINSLSITNPLTGGTDKVALQMADPVEEKILHFVAADGARTPTLTFFSGEDEYITTGPPNCNSACVYTANGFAWNHGGLFADMTTIWLGLVGPGVAHRGLDETTWADQTDARPTILALTGLHDDYPVDGRVLVEDLRPESLPRAMREDHPALERLGAAYKQILAAEGRFAIATLTASTKGIAGDDALYQATEQKLAALDTDRNHLADTIQHALLGAEFEDRPVQHGEAERLIEQADQLLDRADRLAAS